MRDDEEVPYRLENVLATRVTSAAPSDDLLRVLISDEAAMVFRRSGSLHEVLRIGDRDDVDIETRVRIAAWRELTTRLAAEPPRRTICVDSTANAFEVFKHLALAEHEEFHAAFLDAKLRLISTERLAWGSTTGVTFEPSALFRRALMAGAAAVLVAHCHPSGVANPSSTDIDLTKRLARGAESIGVRFIDHIIVAAGGGYYSFADPSSV